MDKQSIVLHTSYRIKKKQIVQIASPEPALASSACSHDNAGRSAHDLHASKRCEASCKTRLVLHLTTYQNRFQAFRVYAQCCSKTLHKRVACTAPACIIPSRSGRPISSSPRPPPVHFNSVAAVLPPVKCIAPILARAQSGGIPNLVLTLRTSAR